MLDKERGLYIAHSENGPISMVGKMANRHGLIAGATGTGKTVTLQVIAETFCQAGVPCFMADMKGDLRESARSESFPASSRRDCPSSALKIPSSRAALCVSSTCSGSRATR